MKGAQPWEKIKEMYCKKIMELERKEQQLLMSNMSENNDYPTTKNVSQCSCGSNANNVEEFCSCEDLLHTTDYCSCESSTKRAESKSCDPCDEAVKIIQQYKQNLNQNFSTIQQHNKPTNSRNKRRCPKCNNGGEFEDALPRILPIIDDMLDEFCKCCKEVQAIFSPLYRPKPESSDQNFSFRPDPAKCSSMEGLNSSSSSAFHKCSPCKESQYPRNNNDKSFSFRPNPAKCSSSVGLDISSSSLNNKNGPCSKEAQHSTTRKTTTDRSLSLRSDCVNSSPPSFHSRGPSKTTDKNFTMRSDFLKNSLASINRSGSSNKETKKSKMRPDFEKSSEQKGSSPSLDPCGPCSKEVKHSQKSASDKNNSILKCHKKDSSNNKKGRNQTFKSSDPPKYQSKTDRSSTSAKNGKSPCTSTTSFDLKTNNNCDACECSKQITNESKTSLCGLCKHRNNNESKTSPRQSNKSCCGKRNKPQQQSSSFQNNSSCPQRLSTTESKSNTQLKSHHSEDCICTECLEKLISKYKQYFETLEQTEPTIFEESDQPCNNNFQFFEDNSQTNLYSPNNVESFSNCEESSDFNCEQEESDISIGSVDIKTMKDIIWMHEKQKKLQTKISCLEQKNNRNRNRTC